MSSRTTTTTGALARLGFADPERAAGLLGDPALLPLRSVIPDGQVDEVVGAVGDTADPDEALLALVRVLESLALRDDDPEWGITALCADLVTPGQSRDRVLAVLGGSTALVDHLVRHPDH